MAKHWIATAAHCVPFLTKYPEYETKQVLETKRETGSTKSPFLRGKREQARSGAYVHDSIFTHEKMLTDDDTKRAMHGITYLVCIVSLYYSTMWFDHVSSISIWF